MIPKQQEVKIEPGLQFDTVVKNSLPKLQPEDPNRAKFFEDLFTTTNQDYIDDPDQGIIVDRQLFINNVLKRQVWIIQFTKFKDEYNDKNILKEYEEKMIEGLLVLPNDFPVSPPKFYFGFFKDNTKIIHENIYGDGLLCIPQLTQSWNKEKGVGQALSAIQAIFYCPNLNDPANPIFAQVPEIEKKRRRQQQAKLFLDWPN